MVWTWLFNFDATFKTFDGSLTNQLLADDVIVQGSQAGHDAAGVYTILGSYKKPLLQLIIPPKLQAVGHGATQPAHLLPAFIWLALLTFHFSFQYK